MFAFRAIHMHALHFVRYAFVDQRDTNACRIGNTFLIVSFLLKDFGRQENDSLSVETAFPID